MREGRQTLTCIYGGTRTGESARHGEKRRKEDRRKGIKKLLGLTHTTPDLPEPPSSQMIEGLGRGVLGDCRMEHSSVVVMVIIGAAVVMVVVGEGEVMMVVLMAVVVVPVGHPRVK